MQNSFAGIALALGSGFAVSAALIPAIIRFAATNGWYDRHDSRKIHAGKIPRLGGLALFAGFAVALFATFLAGYYRDDGQQQGSFWALAFGSLVIHLVGLADDFLDLRARAKFLVQLGVATGLVVLGFRFRVILVPFGDGTLELGLLSYPLTVAWIVGVTNAVNLIDGMDGLAGGISGIAALVFGLFFLSAGNLGAALVCFSLFGAAAGFLAFNLPPARIFMGDSGSLFLGFVLSVLPLLGPARGIVEVGFISAATILLVPIFDTIAAILRRWMAGVSFFSPDRRHIHHKLLAMGLPVRGALLVIYLSAVLLGGAALSTLVLPRDESFWIKMASWAALMAFFLFLHIRSPKEA